jgi:predicted methyltransferase
METARRLLGGMLMLLLAGLTHPAEAPRDPVAPRTPGPLFPPALASLLDARARDRWQKPEQIVAALRLSPGDAVADIGAGSGYMMPHLSQAVGATGRVYAQDVQPAMVRRLAARARAYGNVRVLRGSESDPGLPAASVDGALLLTAYHELTAPVALLSRLRRSVRPGGRLLIVDFGDFAPGEGTPAVTPGDRVSEAAVRREAARAGWRLVRRHAFLPYQYCLEFARH